MAGVLGDAQPSAPPEMRRVVWTDEAIANLDAIAVYIGEFNPLAAQRLALRLKAAGDSLADYSERGRSIHGGMRELTVIYPYLIRYRVTAETVAILRVRHGVMRPD